MSFTEVLGTAFKFVGPALGASVPGLVVFVWRRHKGKREGKQEQALVEKMKAQGLEYDYRPEASEYDTAERLVEKGRARRDLCGTYVLAEVWEYREQGREHERDLLRVEASRTPLARRRG